MTRLGIVTASTGPGRRVAVVAAPVRDVAENYLGVTGGEATLGRVEVAPLLMGSEQRELDAHHDARRVDRLVRCTAPVTCELLGAGGGGGVTGSGAR
jgi:hypothetical protein